MPVRKRRKLREPGTDHELVIQTWDIDDVVPHPKNVRVHSEANIQAIARSIEQFGQRTPIVLGKGKHEGKACILKGCGTWMAMKRRGDKAIQIVQVNHLSDEEEIAYAIADNKTSDMSEFDFESLADVLRYLNDEGVDLAATGFEKFEIDPLLEAEFVPKQVKTPKEETAQYKVIFEVDDGRVVVNAINQARSQGLCPQNAKDGEALAAICRRFITKPRKANR